MGSYCNGFILGTFYGGVVGGAGASVGGPVMRRVCGCELRDFEGKGLIGGALFGGVVGGMRAEAAEAQRRRAENGTNHED